MAKPLLPSNPEIQAAAKAAGINVPYYGVQIVGDQFRFFLYGGRTVTVSRLPGIGEKAAPPGGTAPQRAEPQRPKPVLSVTEGPAVTLTGSLDKMTKAELVALAARLGINPRSKATKAQIISLIEEVNP